ncbi:S49 family peptidase [Kiloniella sp. b19]|uniref:S49 family peptidase n=1 Tax=Kiloniella sp. GXU_MW_B19 TaxID=3141326 RepID=UPI0031D28CE4
MKLSKLKKLPLIKKLFDSDPEVSVVHLKGVIGSGGALNKGLTLASVQEQLEQAFTRKDVKAVALVINSPGGSPVQSDLIGRRIRQLAEENEVRVIAFCEDVAASGGYWLACSADMIYVLPSSVIGSIGVISAGFGFPELIKRYGIERRVRTAGISKSTLDPFKEEKEEDIERLQGILGDIHEDFKDWVRTRRAGRLQDEEDILFNGEFWAGRKAVDLGLVDEVGDLHSVLRKEYGKDVKLFEAEAKQPLMKRLMGAFSDPMARSFVTTFEERLESRSLFSRFGL